MYVKKPNAKKKNTRKTLMANTVSTETYASFFVKHDLSDNQKHRPIPIVNKNYTINDSQK
ncbi:hypothetical protein GsuE55_37840 (plasmid) [Geobacillus subterraneus]|uniref:Uncharacterized protein n=1 Tax=Geobacillus subterraneus TaxID=129338 RepID=A0A679G4H4_9BACL|nr:hypothetical protein GsuE55_37840 [Geobacillus subterraneus]